MKQCMVKMLQEMARRHKTRGSWMCEGLFEQAQSLRKRVSVVIHMY